jgi:hypothetical protein
MLSISFIEELLSYYCYSGLNCVGIASVEKNLWGSSSRRFNSLFTPILFCGENRRVSVFNIIISHGIAPADTIHLYVLLMIIMNSSLPTGRRETSALVFSDGR